MSHSATSEKIAELYTRALALEQEGKFKEALDLRIEISTLEPRGVSQNQESLQRLILYSLSEKDLVSLLSNPHVDPHFGWVFYRLGQLSRESGSISAAILHFESASEKLKDSVWANKAREQAEELRLLQKVSPQTIGVVLPLSGKSSKVGQMALRGVQLGLGLHYENSPIKLAIVDSEGNPDVARRGVDRLVKTDGVIGIIGDISGKSSWAAASSAEEYHVPILSLSQRSRLTEAGTHVFQNALSSELQIYFLARTAIQDLGMKKFGILFPNDSYGVEMSNLFWDAVRIMGGGVAAVQSYAITEKDFRFPIQRMVGTFYGEARLGEIRERRAELAKQKRGSGTSRADSQVELLKPIVDFDAVFVPDSAKTLGQVSAMFAFNDVRKITFLGTNLWNTQDVGKRLTPTHDILFVDSLPPTLSGNSFAQEYQNLFGSDPGFIELQAYDAGLVFRQALSAGANTRDGLLEFLTQLRTIKGSLGLTQITKDRVFIRPTWAYTLKDQKLTPLE